jgi:type I restriction enzyme R subunit
LLLMMATGTGKTFEAFQIIWRLWKAKRARLVLFLADRNTLVNPTMSNDLRPFSQAMAKLSNSSSPIEKFDESLEKLTLALNRERGARTTSKDGRCWCSASG